MLGRALAEQQVQPSRKIQYAVQQQRYACESSSTHQPISPLSRVQSLEFSQHKRIISGHQGNVTWLHLEHIEQRYLLSGAADASIAIHDTVVPSHPDQHAACWIHQPVAIVPRRHPAAHKLMVTAVCWYPVDTGLFVSSGFDSKVKVWDTNQLECVSTFDLEDKVYTCAMSVMAAGQSLVAVGTTGTAVRLIDPLSGSVTHTLVGHTAGVMALAWSPREQHTLVTGGADGVVLVWDVRRAGVLDAFDPDRTTKVPPGGRPGGRLGGRRSTRFPSAHAGVVTGLCSTPDGSHWVTGGTDNRVRLWDGIDRRHLLVHYPGTYNSARKPRQLATSSDHSVLFHPSGSVVQCYSLQDGRALGLLRGHFDSINAVAYNPMLQELYTGANDCSVAVWSPEGDSTPGLGGDKEDSDGDAWSDG